MEDIKTKAHEDELNKAEDLIEDDFVDSEELEGKTLETKRRVQRNVQDFFNNVIKPKKQ